jgi:S-sulfo-L-cysteine synthase (3-phospho-L-serine-dependent)
MRTLVLVKTGWSLSHRMLAFRTFAARGWRLAVMDRALNQSLRVADVPVTCDPSATAAAVTALRARVGQPDGIVTFSDSALAATARLAGQLGLPFLPVEVADRVTDKRRQRELFAEAGLPVPDWRCPGDEEDAARAVRAWGPTVIKPADRAASVAVRLVDTCEAARLAYREAARASRHGGAVLAERYLPGPEVSVESIAVEGRQEPVCVTAKVTTRGPHFVELGHAVPAALDPEELARVVDAARSACRALDLGWGACHTEVKLTEAGPVVVEVNARLAGDSIPDLVELALGVNLYELLGRQAFGEPLTRADLASPRRGAAAIHFLPSTPGVFLGATSPLEASPPDWLVELSVTAAPSQRLGEPASNSDRIGYAIACGAGAPEAADRALFAIRSLAVRAEPGG